MVNAVNFNGNTYIRSNLLTVSEAPFSCGNFSYFYKSSRANTGYILVADGSDDDRIEISHQVLNGGGPFLQVLLRGNSYQVEYQSLNPLPVDGGWHFVTIAWNTDISGSTPGSFQFFNWGLETGSQAFRQTSGSQLLNGFLITDLSLIWYVGGFNSINYTGSLAEVFFLAHNNDLLNDNIIYDLNDGTIASSFFRDLSFGSGLAVSSKKGQNGSIPLDKLPGIYLHGGADNFPANHGGNSSFQVVGGLVDAIDDPREKLEAVSVVMSNVRGVLRVITNRLTAPAIVGPPPRTRAVRG